MQEEQKQVLWFCHECKCRGVVEKDNKREVLAKSRKAHERAVPRCTNDASSFTYICDLDVLMRTEKLRALSYLLIQ